MAQTDTVFYNKSWKPTKVKDSIAYYRLAHKRSDLFEVRDHYLTGKLQMEGNYTSLDPEVREGYFKYYDSAGKLSAEEYFVANKREGRWVTYFSPSGSRKSIVAYRNDSLNGQRILFDSLSGKIYLVDTFVNGKREGVATWYFKGTEKINRTRGYSMDSLNGPTVVYDSISGNVIARHHYKNGKLHGVTTYYTPSGKLQSQLTRENGILNGPATHFDTATGKIRKNGPYVDGHMQGNWTFYHKDSERPSEINYCENDTANGPSTKFYISGNKAGEGNLQKRNKSGEWIFYFDREGLVRSKRHFINGVAEGLTRYYDSATGNLKAEGLYKKNKKDGKWTYYYPATGKIDGIEFFIEGKLEGELVHFFPSGSKKRVSYYKDGKHIGVETYYYEDGRVESEARYSGNGSKSTYVEYDSASGNVVERGAYSNGQKDGAWVKYDPVTRALISEEYFKSGLNDGLYSYFFPDGKKRVAGRFLSGMQHGKWSFYYEGTGKTWIMVDFQNGKFNGELTCYYPDGKLKRREKYDHGVLGASECYSEFGDEVAYSPLVTKPEFVGDVFKFIGNELVYPQAAASAGIEGTVIVDFIVEEDGSISNAFIRKGLDPDCDNEALRIVNMMPKWTPAQIDGQDLKWTASIPIVFWIRDSDEN